MTFLMEDVYHKIYLNLGQATAEDLASVLTAMGDLARAYGAHGLSFMPVPEIELTLEDRALKERGHAPFYFTLQDGKNLEDLFNEVLGQ